MSLTPQTDRKRDRLRVWFRRSPSPMPGYTTPGPTQPAISTSTNTSVASSILADALDALRSDHRETIRISLQPTNVVSAEDAFDEVHAHARELKQRSKIKRWTWTYKDRQIYLFEQADKVVRLLDRFKAVGDIVANVDPVHVGLPWAGVRTILEVALADSNQRAVLVTGIELALYVSNRLKVYLETFAGVSSSAAKDNLRRSIVSLYAHILEFLAHAIHVQQKGRAATLITALWNLGDLTEFEEKCDRLCVRTGEEARICDSRTSRETQLQTLRKIHEFQTGLLRLDAKVDLSKLETAKEATYNSSAEGELPRCLPDTRTDLLEQIFDWAADHAGKRIFWLCGKAGTGKSTISRTVAQKLDDDGLLGASFFFKRGRADRSHAKLLFPTIARQLADLFPDLAQLVAAALDQDSLLCDRCIKIQFDSLLLEPLQNVDQDSFSSASIVLVIDALDECDNSESIKKMLLLLSRLEAITSVRLRIFVTSRPELPVELGFRKMSGDLHHDVRLEEAQEGAIAHDIRVFYEHQFSEVRDASSLQVDELPAHWPGDENIRLLVGKAIPLFIFAFTVCRYIAANPERNLDIILCESRHKSLSGLKGTYMPILNSAVAFEGDGKEEDRIFDFKRIVGIIVLLYDPLAASALAHLLNLHVGDIDRVLRPLHSVLNIPRAPNGRMDCTTPITLFHLSFRDFLVDSALKNENRFWVDAKETHRTLGMHCIRLLESGGLKEDVCGVVAPGTRRSAIAKSKVHSSLPEDVAYACCYWVQHVVSSGEQIKDDGAVHQFLHNHMLHWIEALSWLGKASDVVHHIVALRSYVDINHGKRLSSLTDDANHFVLRNNYIIDLAPLQIYISALLFAPSFSTVRQVFGDSLKSLFVTMPRVPAHWGAEKQILEGHESGVTRAVCSTDGRRIVSSGYDHCVRVWDVVTGEQCKVFVGHSDWVSAVDLSADGETVASVADDETVRLWSVTSGQERAKLDIGMMAEQRHDVRTDEPCIGAVAFSPDNSTLATACYDTTVQLWDPKTGKVQRTLEGHTEWVRSIAFSNNGEVIATGAGDGIRLWNVSEGKEIRTLKGSLTGCISVVKISPDGEMLASGSEDGCIRFWNMKTGEFINRLDEHTDHDCTIEDLAFSPDGRILASTCHDHAVSLWDIATREGISRLRGHEDIVNSVAFLPDGKAVVTASDDATVRLWDISANIELHKTEAHSEAVSAVAFSRNGRLLASAANMDEFGVRLWDTASGAQMLKIACFELSANVIIFSPDGNTVTLLWDNDVKGEWAITRDNGTQLLRASSIRRKAHKSYHHELVDNNPSQNSDDHCESAYQEGSSGSQHKMTVVTSWIRRNDEDFIWLPFEYRAVCYSTFGASIAIGRASGAITILSLL